MQYRTFDDYKKGYSHIKIGAECEDYASSYQDPKGRYVICAACDGHSDKNCFRSDKGAEFGCEAAITIMKRFFDLYCNAPEEEKKCGVEDALRLKQAVKQFWDDLVFKDLEQKPVTEEDLKPLTDRVREIYEAGKGLLNIYGTTRMAVGATDGLCVALHIGDGIMLFVDTDGSYYNPLPYDDKSDTPSPASLCDTDLFTRENAFRCQFFSKLPCAVLVSSDGIGDCMDQIEFKEFFHSLVSKIDSLEDKDDRSNSLNEAQRRFLESCTAFYADKGNGVEDDCCLSGFYSLDEELPLVSIPGEEAEKMLKEVVEERERIELDYGKRKNDITNALDNLEEAFKESQNDEIREKIENTRDILKNIEENETAKISALDSRIRTFEEYVKRSSGEVKL